MRKLLAWAGGKHRLSSLIIKRIPEHTCYCEPFCGGASVFFAKPPSKVEVLNDVDEELVNLYEVVRSDPDAFAAGYEYLLVSRRQYGLFKIQDPSRLCPAARAVRFFYLISLGFGCKRNEMSFGTSAVQPRPRMAASRVIDHVREVHRRLESVVIECLPATDCIRLYDRPTTFFFVDPPYHGVSQPYAPNARMTEADQEALRDALGAAKGRWLVTLNEHPVVRRLYRGWRFERVPTRYSLMRKEGNRADVHQTLLIANYDPPRRR